MHDVASPGYWIGMQMSLDKRLLKIRLVRGMNPSAIAFAGPFWLAVALLGLGPPNSLEPKTC